MHGLLGTGECYIITKHGQIMLQNHFIRTCTVYDLMDNFFLSLTLAEKILLKHFRLKKTCYHRKKMS